MSAEDKVIKLMVNLFNHNPHIVFCYNEDKYRYEITGLRLQEGFYALDMFFSDYPNRSKAENTVIVLSADGKEEAVSIGTKNIDTVIEAIQDSWLDYLLKDIVTGDDSHSKRN